MVGNKNILPYPEKVLENLINFGSNHIGLGSLTKNIGFSLGRVILGYSLGVLIALPLGLLMGYKSAVRGFFENFINLFRPIPSLAWQPLVLGWFGIQSLATLFNMPFGQSYAIMDNFKLSMIFIISQIGRAHV